MKPQVSVIINSYNHAPFVGEAIKSVLDQSFQDFEIVIADDGSTDGTPDIVRRYSDPRITFEAFPRNRGAVIAANSLRQRATGEFLAKLSSDDYFLPGKLEKQVKFLRTNPQVAVVFGMPRLVDERGRPVGDGYREFTFPFAHPDPSRQQWLRHFFFKGNCLCNPTSVIRREVQDEIGLRDPRMWNLPDFDYWVRLCMVHEIHVMQEELTAYRILDSDRNVSAPRPEAKLRRQFETFQILKHYRNMPPELAREVFADDLARHGLDANAPHRLWLAELALREGPTNVYKLFALDTMFEACSENDQYRRRLIELTGSVDLFGGKKWRPNWLERFWRRKV